MKRLIRNKRGVDAFTFLLTIFAIAALTFILIGLTMKYNKLNNTIGDAGSSASMILSTYDKADSALLYLDNAVSISMRDAIYGVAGNGFYPSGQQGGCGARNGYVFWSRGFAKPVEGEGACEAKLDSSCVPGSYGAFYSDFNDNLKRQLAAYNIDSDVKLPEDGYAPQLGIRNSCAGAEGCFEGTGQGPLQLIGKASQNVVVDSARLHYEVNPSFRVNSDVDLVGDFEKLAGRVGQLTGKDRAAMERMLASFSSETGLDWDVESYDRACWQACNTGKECTYCCEYGEAEVSCATEEDPDCKKTETVCVKDCEGNLNQYYCDVAAGISVMVPDADYKTAGSAGHKGFVASGSGGKPEVREYAYGFGLNWVEMQETMQCI